LLAPLGLGLAMPAWMEARGVARDSVVAAASSESLGLAMARAASGLVIMAMLPRGVRGDAATASATSCSMPPPACALASAAAMAAMRCASRSAVR